MPRASWFLLLAVLFGCSAPHLTVPEGTPPLVVLSSDDKWSVLDSEGLRTLELPPGATGFEASVVVTSDGRVAYAVGGEPGGSLRVLGDGDAVPLQASCGYCVTLAADDEGGVWALVRRDSSSRSVDLQHFDRDLRLVSTATVAPIPDAHPFADDDWEITPSFVYVDGARVILENKASDGVFRGGPFNLARVGPDGTRTATTQTSLRVAAAVPNADRSLLALRTTGSGGACATEDEIDFLDPTLLRIERSVDLTQVVLGDEAGEYQTVVGSSGQWIGERYLIHVWSLDSFPDADTCSGDLGWLLIDARTGASRRIPSDRVSTALGVPRDTSEMSSVDGSCDHLIIQRDFRALELVAAGHRHRLADDGALAAGGGPLPDACFSQLLDER